MKIERYEKFIILSILLCMLLLRAYKITVAPGLEAPQSLDENYIGMYAAKVMNGEMITSLFYYIGPHGIYIATISSYIFNLNIFSIRFISVLISISSFLILYYLVRDRYGFKTAVIFSLMLQLLPSYIIQIRPFYTHMINYLLFILIFYLLFKFDATKNRNIIYLIAFLIGSSIAIHIHAIYFIAALLVSSIILKITIPKKYIIYSLPFLLIGMIPFIYYNLTPCDTGELFCTFKYVQSNVFLTGKGIYNIETMQNFIGLSKVFLFSSFNIWPSLDYLSPPEIFISCLSLFTFFILIAASVIYAAMKKNKTDLFLIFFLGIFFIENIFTLGGIGPFTLLILLPVLFILISNLISKFKIHIIASIIIFVIVLNSLAFMKYFDNFKDNDVASIENVAEYVKDAQKKNVVVDDWIVYYAMVFHVGNEKNVYRCYSYNETEDSVFVFYSIPAFAQEWFTMKGTYIACSDEFYSWVNQYLSPKTIGEYNIFS
ncbi:MAG: glycosyltransferase family 39 protein [Candidatus Aenigmatarchaeota archaeon]